MKSFEFYREQVFFPPSSFFEKKTDFSNYFVQKNTAFWYFFGWWIMMMGLTIHKMTGVRRIMQFNPIQFIWVYRVLVMAFNFWVQLTNYLAIVLALQVKNKPYTVIALDKCLLMCGAYRWEYPMLLLHPMKMWYNTIQWQCNAMQWNALNTFQWNFRHWARECISVGFFLLFSRLFVCFIFIVHLLCYSIDVDICEMCQFSLPQSWLSLVWFGLVDEFAVYAVYRMNYTNQTTMPHYFRSQVYFYEMVPKFKLLSSICVKRFHQAITDWPTERPISRPLYWALLILHNYFNTMA